jgi:hypothetical protein
MESELRLKTESLQALKMYARERAAFRANRARECFFIIEKLRSRIHGLLYQYRKKTMPIDPVE